MGSRWRDILGRVSVLLLAAGVASLPISTQAEPAKGKKAKSSRGTKKREDTPATPAPAAPSSPPRGARGADKRPEPEPAPNDATRGLQRGERVEFDARLIQGQVARAGAVYLFERASTNLHSMVRERTGYRSEIEGLVYPLAAKGSPQERARPKSEPKPVSQERGP